MCSVIVQQRWVDNHSVVCDDYSLVLVLHAGVPGVQADKLAEGMNAQHCALSLVGEPIMYPKINDLVRLLHQKKISTFLVTNAQFPDAIRFVPP